jgi:hypothetical protein
MFRVLVLGCFLLLSACALTPRSSGEAGSCSQLAVAYLQKAESYGRCLSTIGCIVDYQATKERDLAKARAEVACAE